MKKVLRNLAVVVAMLAMAFAFCACAAPAENSSNNSDSNAASSDEPQMASSAIQAGSDDGNTLVAYFSATGNTKAVAETIAQNTGGTLFEIVPAEPYTSEDLDYNDPASRTSLEHDDPSVRPGITGAVDNWDSYDTVFIGYPIWWGDSPAIMQTFVESYDWNGKTVVAFCTSSSNGFGSSDSVLKEATPGATWLDGQRFSQGASASDIESWVDGLGV